MKCCITCVERYGGKDMRLINKNVIRTDWATGTRLKFPEGRTCYNFKSILIT